MANTYLTRTPSSAGNRRTWTWSSWIKRSTTGSEYVYSWGYNEHNVDGFNFDSNDKINVWGYQSGTNYSLLTNRRFKDVNGYYHIVIKYDSTQATASNRLKIYVNGVQETSFSPETYPNQNHEALVNNTIANRIGQFGWNNDDYFSGVISHIHFIDGTAYEPSTFGSTDSTTGEWKINPSPTISSYGTNGFFLLKDGNIITDQSPNSNNYTLAGGTLTKTEDNPSNVFATLNPLVYNTSNKVYGFGNTAITSSPNNSGEWQSTQTTLGASTGKYYCEIKMNAIGNYHNLGVGYQPNITNVTSTLNIGELSGSFGYRNNGGTLNSGSTGTSLSTYTTGDIIGVAMDLTNSKLYFSKNGTWENSGNPESGATGTGSLTNLTAGEAYHFVIAPRGSSTYCNFGNGYFGTTAVSSAGTNASGIGIFEYDVPTGYTALSTKGLNL